MTSLKLCSRRHLIRMSGFGLGGIAASMLLRDDGLLADDSTALSKPILEPQIFDLLPKASPKPARAKAMISMFTIGGASQIDMFDPKLDLSKRDGQEYSVNVTFDNAAQASRKLMASMSKFHHRGKSGMEMSELIPHMGEIADDNVDPFDAYRREQPRSFALCIEYGIGRRGPRDVRQLAARIAGK